MKRSRMVGLIVLLALATALSGCVGKPVRLPSVTTAAPGMGDGEVLTGKACGFQLFLLIPVAINGRHLNAYRSLVRQADGRQLTDIEVKEEWFYGFVGTGYCTTMRATALPKVAAAN